MSYSVTDTHSVLTKEITNHLSKKEKKDYGIFFTPSEATDECVERVKKYYPSPIDVLEPSCGSGQFIDSVQRKMPLANITAVEYNDEIYDKIKGTYPDVIHDDFIDYVPQIKYDLIIGNPPYFVMKKDDVDRSYLTHFDGRPNIFILFIIKCLGLLKPKGTLCFVLPKNFLNCIYYDKTRKYIFTNFVVQDIFQPSGKYIDTQQDTIVIIVQNIPSVKTSPFVIHMSNYTIFGTPVGICELTKIKTNSTTLGKMGFSVSVGKTVWNQHKPSLTSDASKTRLVYSSDIKCGKVGIVTYKNTEKKNYINKPGGTGKVLLVNRGYGVGEYKFEYCLYNGDRPYLVENHLMCIHGPDDGSYEKIVSSFDDPRTKKFIVTYFNNNAINTSELANIFPIFI